MLVFYYILTSIGAIYILVIVWRVFSNSVYDNGAQTLSLDVNTFAIL